MEEEINWLWNEMNRALGHLCAHIGWTGPGEPHEDGEMNEITLSSRHRIQNSSPGGLRPSTIPLGHGGSPQYGLSHVDGEETFCFFQTAETGNRTPNSGVKGSGSNHNPRAPALIDCVLKLITDRTYHFYDTLPHHDTIRPKSSFLFWLLICP